MSPSVELEKIQTVADLVHQLGDVPLERIRMRPLPGTATVKDLIALSEGPNKVLCELIDGVLVEKVMGATEAHLALRLGGFIELFLDEHNLGAAFGSDGPFRILPGLVRLPDVSVFTWESLPERKFPKMKVPKLVPDIAVEVLSESNTRREIQRKLKEYFLAGVKQVWIIYPKKKSAEVYTAPDKRQRISPDQSLTGGDILPGFALPLKKLFGQTAGQRKKK